MKGILFIFLFWHSILFVQVNPWENKKTENPWKTETTETAEAKKTESIDSVSQQVERVDTIDRAPTKAELTKIADDATDQYKSGTDFAVGFTSGLVLNYFGLLIDGIYSIPTTKKEKAVVEQIKSDTTYQDIKPEIVESKAENAIKKKKIGSAVGGTLLGSVVQLAIILGIAIL